MFSKLKENSNFYPATVPGHKRFNNFLEQPFSNSTEKAKTEESKLLGTQID